MYKLPAALAAAWLVLAAPSAFAGKLSTPQLHLAPSSTPRVALTLDACMGQTDERILQSLIAHKVKATIFATARWIRRNPAALAEINAHRELFRVENHGANHLAAVLDAGRVFGVRTVGDAAGLADEINNGAAAVAAATGRKPEWFRGATAEYSADAMQEIAALGERVAGFSVLGDGGALFSSAHAAKAIASAHDGDVIIAHINQPKKPAGSGVIAGVLALQAKGFQFVWLDEALPHATHPTTAHR